MDKAKMIFEIFDRFISFDYAEKDDEFQKFLQNLSRADDICKSYAEISQVIYNLKDEDFTKLANFFGVLKKDDPNHFEGYLDLMELDNLKKDNLAHFERHIVLSCWQRRYVSDITKDASDEVANVKGKVTKIYSEFVGILGVFTALSFALMGSVQVFGNILNNINNPTVGNVGYVLIVGGIYLILIYLVIMTLFIGMGKVFNKDSKYQFDKCFTWYIIFVSVMLIAVGLVLVLIG
ncbi:hypothetical protein G8B22_08605 [Ligilactobacillus agilis]|uniref:hypothetical protein n=1 Tax=Ligilactobacillus agilis TaxID=1601 RepID=UPI001F592655|nr:hypothetical protein [Ligilactobacillus agilis]UNL43188.1 hypothetical protein G8B22_08605 [Ligilactobacillus agilis]UNL57816.1 hypothetical protein G8B19_03115 [Ligilactobacillus agilis]